MCISMITGITTAPAIKVVVPLQPRPQGFSLKKSVFYSGELEIVFFVIMWD